MPDASPDAATDERVEAPPEILTRHVPAEGSSGPTSRRDSRTEAAPTRFITVQGRSVVVRPRVPVILVGLLLVALHVAATAVRVAEGWWWQDDINILAAVSDRPLTVGLLLQDYNGHLQPMAWLMGWMVTHLSPYSWLPAVVVQTLLVAATDLTFFALLRRLFGSRPAILVPLAAYCASGLTLTATVWWAAAMQWLPATLCLAVALFCHVGYVTTGRRRDAVGAVAAMAGGLLCFEKALTVLPVLALVSLLHLTPGGLLRRPWRALNGQRMYWVAHAALAAGYLALYFTRTSVVATPSSSLGDALDLGRQMLLYTAIPGVLGGPLEWYAGPDSVSSLPVPPPAFLHATWGVALVLVIGSMVARRRAWRAWLLFGLYVGATVAMLAWTRGGILGPTIGRDVRYSTDLALLTTLCAALAWLPLRAGPRADPARGATATGPEPTDHDDARTAPVHDEDVVHQWSARRPGAAAAAVSAAVVLLTAGGLVSGAGFMRAWTTNPAESYMRNLRAGVTAAGPDLEVFDGRVPRRVMIPEFGPAAYLSHVTRPFERQPRFVTWGPAVRVVDESGRVRAAKVTGTASALSRPVCGRKKVTVRLPSSALEWAWKVQLTYTATAATPAVVTVGGGRVEVELKEGRHDVFASLIGGGSTVTVTGLAPGTRVCVSSAVVGEAVPAS